MKLRWASAVSASWLISEGVRAADDRTAAVIPDSVSRPSLSRVKVQGWKARDSLVLVDIEPWWESSVHASIMTENHGENAALYGWLRRDRDLLGFANVTGRCLPGSQTLSALDFIDVTLTHVTGFASLALAIISWRQSRRHRVPITITRADGHALTIDGGSVVTAELIQSFLVGGDATADLNRDGESHVDDAVTG